MPSSSRFRTSSGRIWPESISSQCNKNTRVMIHFCFTACRHCHSHRKQLPHNDVCFGQRPSCVLCLLSFNVRRLDLIRRGDRPFFAQPSMGLESSEWIVLGSLLNCDLLHGELLSQSRKACNVVSSSMILSETGYATKAHFR